MGCLKLLIKVVIIIFAIIGFKAAGCWDWCVKTFHILKETPSQEAMIEKSRDVADFSAIPDEYEIAKSANILGYRAVIAGHDATGQKFAVVNENKALKLTKQDFKDGSLKKKIDAVNKKLEYQYIHVENFQILKQGTMKAMGQTVPYAQFQADVTNLPVKTLKGIIAVAQDDEGKSKILVSANEKGKYSQIIAEQFFRHVKFTREEAEKGVKKEVKDKEQLKEDKEKIAETAQKAKELIENKIKKTEKNAE